MMWSLFRARDSAFRPRLLAGFSGIRQYRWRPSGDCSRSVFLWM